MSLRIAYSFSFQPQSNVTVGWPHLSRSLEFKVRRLA